VPLLSTKELSIVEEQIQAEELAIAKCEHYMSISDDENVFKLLEAMHGKHQVHRSILFRHLKPNG